MPKFEKRYLSAKEINHVYGISPKILSLWRLKGVGPCFVKLGPKMFRYKITDIEEFLEKNTILTKEVTNY